MAEKSLANNNHIQSTLPQDDDDLFQNSMGNELLDLSYEPILEERNEEEEQEEQEISHEDELDEFEEEDRKAEENIDFAMNTPLLWAAFKGHFQIVWLLLLDGYSSNDLDNSGNNALHLAAANGNLKVVKALINDGANSNLVNLYKNLPIDMSVNKDVREALAIAMDKYASVTPEDIIFMNYQNIKMVRNEISNLD